MRTKRRSVLQIGAVGVGVTAAGFTLPLGQSARASDWISTSAKPARFARPLPVPQPITGRDVVEDGVTYREFVLSEQRFDGQVLDGSTTKTPLLGYAQAGGSPSVPGPLIKVEANTPVKMVVRNELPATHPTFGHALITSVHLHGSASLPQYDGYADDVTRPNMAKAYYYPNHQGPRTLWYHDHAMHVTAPNVYSGLVAQYHITNAWERANLPQGKYDVPLTISDVILNQNGSLAHLDRDHSGLWGDIILVNGTPWPYLDVERRYYRFRVLMATLSRSMNLKFVNTRTGATLPTYAVATDGGLMVPQRITSWRHGGAERYEVMVDFSSCALNDRVELRNSSNKNNRDYLYTGKVMQFRVTAESTETRWNTVVTPPASEIHEVMSATAGMAKATRHIELDRENGEFTINGLTWRDVQDANWNIFLDDSSDPPRPGDYEIWRIENSSGGWFHPLHIHLVDFKILRRTDGSGRVQPYEKGPKDVVYVGENETVEVLVHYTMPPKAYPSGRSTGKAGATGDRGGRYMIHCHNLPHEDHDMMGQFFVAASDGTVDLSGTAPNHPVYAAQPQNL